MPGRVLVFGAGAIGQWIGARLAFSSQDVTLLVRPRQAEAIRAHGLVLKEGGHSHIVRTLKVATEVSALQSEAAFEWILITVKGYDADASVRDLAPLLAGSSRLVLFQNGLGTEGAAVAAVGGERVFFCSVTKALQTPDAGVVEEMNLKSGVGLAPYLPETPMADLEAVFRTSAVPYMVHPRYHDIKWSKLLLNILGNAVCAITDMSTAAVFEHKGLFNLESRAFTEAVSVMQAKGAQIVALPGYPVPLLKTVMTALPQVLLQPLMRRRMAEGRGNKVPSLRLDMQKEPPRSEVQYLNGAVVREGRSVSVRTPANEFISETLQSIVDGHLKWDVFRKKPERLYAAFKEYLDRSRRGAKPPVVHK